MRNNIAHAFSGLTWGLVLGLCTLSFDAAWAAGRNKRPQERHYYAKMDATQPVTSERSFRVDLFAHWWTQSDLFRYAFAKSAGTTATVRPVIALGHDACELDNGYPQADLLELAIQEFQAEPYIRLFGIPSSLLASGFCNGGAVTSEEAYKNWWKDRIRTYATAVGIYYTNAGIAAPVERRVTFGTWNEPNVPDQGGGGGTLTEEEYKILVGAIASAVVEVAAEFPDMTLRLGGPDTSAAFAGVAGSTTGTPAVQLLLDALTERNIPCTWLRSWTWHSYPATPEVRDPGTLTQGMADLRTACHADLETWVTEANRMGPQQDGPFHETGIYIAQRVHELFTLGVNRVVLFQAHANDDDPPPLGAALGMDGLTAYGSFAGVQKPVKMVADLINQELPQRGEEVAVEVDPLLNDSLRALGVRNMGEERFCGFFAYQDTTGTKPEVTIELTLQLPPPSNTQAELAFAHKALGPEQDPYGVENNVWIYALLQDPLANFQNSTQFITDNWALIQSINDDPRINPVIVKASEHGSYSPEKRALVQFTSPSVRTLCVWYEDPVASSAE